MLYRTVAAAMVVVGALALDVPCARADQSQPGSAPGEVGGPSTTSRGDGRDYGRYGRNDPNSSDFPGIEVHDWISASANAAAARAIFWRAENDVAAAVRRAQHDFERSKDLQNAVAAE